MDFPAGLTLFTTIVNAAKTIGELAKGATGLEEKQRLNEVYDALIGLKQSAAELEDANRDLKTQNHELREQLSLRQKMVRQGDNNYFFLEGDAVPFCPRCWESDGKAVHLTAVAEDTPGWPKRKCIACKQEYYEGRPPARSHQVRGMMGDWPT
jgi:hypothetical protein